MEFDDDEVIVDDERTIGVDEEGSELDELQTDEGQPGEVVDEAIFEINGEKIPYSKLNPDQVQGWYKDAINKAKWQSENTRKAQEIAESRKQYDEWQKSHPQAEKELAEYKAWINFINRNPELAQQIRNVYQQTGGQGINNFNQQQLPPEFAEMKKRLDAFEQRDQEARTDQERKEALDGILATNKDIDKEVFQNFVDEITAKNDFKSLYETLYYAYLGKNMGDLRKQAESEIVNKIKKNRTLDVNPGGGSTQVGVAENIDLTQDYDDMFDEFGRGNGIT